uniref:CCT-theta n=1 Tax=Palpitomonas bilix TaxID=652834 RepID=A0A7S3D0A2_9EUKA|mmetsp:Transcript_16759/g.42079  ORF Transcript_16759/g.42079 Transcript_16759/m.42079 type:complete len:467 (+) Transcript_16759:57-1457(+)
MYRSVGGSSLEHLLKEGTKAFSGVDEAVLRNIEACKELSNITRTSLGPNGMNKLIVNHLSHIFVTNDAATIMREMEVAHPAAKIVKDASQMQEQEIGDFTNFVIVVAGELLKQAEGLLTTGLHASEIIEGYTKAAKKAREVMEELVCQTITDVKDVDAVTAILRPVLMAKQYGLEDKLAKLVAEACIDIVPPKKENFNVDNVRFAKIVGGSIGDSSVVRGMVATRGAEGTIKKVKNAKVVVFTGGIDSEGPETKGTVVIKNAEELEGYNKSEEKMMEDLIDDIVSSGINVIVVGASISEMALHFCERKNIMVIRTPSKFELRRIARTVGATALSKIGKPTPEEIGEIDSISVEEIGSTKVTVFRRDDELSRISTVVIRGATNNFLNDIERSLEDAVNTYKQICKDGRFVPGGGAVESELARLVQKEADSAPGLDQYAIRKFGEALEVIPRTLAENAGLPADEVLSK